MTPAVSLCVGSEWPNHRAVCSRKRSGVFSRAGGRSQVLTSVVMGTVLSTTQMSTEASELRVCCRPALRDTRPAQREALDRQFLGQAVR